MDKEAILSKYIPIAVVFRDQCCILEQNMKGNVAHPFHLRSLVSMQLQSMITLASTNGRQDQSNDIVNTTCLFPVIFSVMDSIVILLTLFERYLTFR